MAGIACIKEFTTIFIPCHLEMARRGLSARRVRRAFKAPKLAAVVPVLGCITACAEHVSNVISKYMAIKLTITIKPSRIVQKLVK